MFELNPREEDFYFWTRVTVYSAKLRSCRNSLFVCFLESVCAHVS